MILTQKTRDRAAWILLGAVLLAAGALRVRLLPVPLERDEGGYAYMASLLLAGIPPYTQAVDIKMPGLYALYALFLRLFGSTASGLHVGLLIVNGTTSVLLYLLGRRLLGRAGGLTSAAVFAFVSVSRRLEGFTANAEHFVLLWALAGIALIEFRRDRGAEGAGFLAGLLMGTAFLMKQVGALFIGFALWQALSGPGRRWNIRTLSRGIGPFACGAALPLALALALLASTGGLRDFWFYIWTVNLDYASVLSFPTGAAFFLRRIRELSDPLLPVGVLAAAGALALAFGAGRSRARSFLPVFLAVSMLAVCPGLYFFPHYFVLLLPAASLLSGAAAAALTGWLRRHGAAGPAAALAVALCLGLWMAGERDYLFRMTPEEVSRAVFPGHPFTEALTVSERIRAGSDPADTIAVLGSEPEIFFYSGRRSCTSQTATYFFAYGLLGGKEYGTRLQRQMMAEIEDRKPRYLVFVQASSSWMIHWEPTALYQWAREHAKEHYRLDGVIGLGPGPNAYLTGDAALRFRPSPPGWMSVYQRRE